jgi:predicted HD phosphohydrolase
MSGYTDYAQYDPAVAEKGAAFIEKPFSAEGLVAKVRDALQR